MVFQNLCSIETSFNRKPSKKTKEFFHCCNPKERKTEPTRIDRRGAREIKRKAKWVKDPLNFNYKRSKSHLPRGGGNIRGREKKRKQEERKRMREYRERI